MTITYYADDQGPKRPVLVYCHTFTGNKLEGKFLLEKHLDRFIVVLFDFRGCGNSSEEFVTLGLREKFDLTFVLRICDDVLKPERIYLWGRSMGAVTVIHYLTHQQKLHRKCLEAKHDPETLRKPNQIPQLEYDYSVFKKVRAIVLDSPFTDSYRMVLDVMRNNMNIPKTLGKIVLLPVTNSIKNNVKFDVLSDNKPVKMCQKLTLPACFMIGEKDALIDPVKFTKMFENYAGENKKLRLLAGTDHADFRQEHDLEFVYRFLFETDVTADKERLEEYQAELAKKNAHFEKVEDKAKLVGGPRRSEEHLKVQENRASGNVKRMTIFDEPKKEPTSATVPSKTPPLPAKPSAMTPNIKHPSNLISDFTSMAKATEAPPKVAPIKPPQGVKRIPSVPAFAKAPEGKPAPKDFKIFE